MSRSRKPSTPKTPKPPKRPEPPPEPLDSDDDEPGFYIPTIASIIERKRKEKGE